MYGDTEIIRRRADSPREQASDIRALADQLVQQVETLAWTGRAAHAVRERMHDRSNHLRDAANRYDTAADSLAQHAHEVDTLKDAITMVERRAEAIRADARTRVARVQAHQGDDRASGVDRSADEQDLVLLAFSPPSPGHREWLGVDLPGL